MNVQNPLPTFTYQRLLNHCVGRPRDELQDAEMYDRYCHKQDTAYTLQGMQQDSLCTSMKKVRRGNVPDLVSRDRDVVLVRRTIHLGKPRGVGKLEWGGNGEGTGRGRSVYEQPGAKVDRIAPCKRRDSK